MQAIWTVSQDADDRNLRPRDGWWSLAEWAAAGRILLQDGTPIGVAAIGAAGAPAVREARLALEPAHRTFGTTTLLVDAAMALTRAAGATKVRLVVPETAAWVHEPAVQRGFSRVRSLHIMLRPAAAPGPPLRPVEGVRIRSFRRGEESALLAALNRAWAGTWDFRPLTGEALAADLRGQRTGFLVAVDRRNERIVGTVYALFTAGGHNPDGGPYAWLSNLTSDPAWRGRGVGRALLLTGLDYLHARGAGSVALGVDGGATVPLALYRSVGFATVGALERWDAPVAGDASIQTTLNPIHMGKQ